MEKKFFIIKNLYTNSRIEPSFIQLLEEEGLVNLQMVDGESCVQESELQNIEQFARWYYDLSINIEGIDVIHNLLHKINYMEKELSEMRKLINNYKTGIEDVDL